MFRFPNIKFVYTNEQEIQFLYDIAIDIFAKYQDKELNKIFQQQDQVLFTGQSNIQQMPSLITHPQDFLKYKVEKTKEQIQQDIINTFNYQTVFDYAGFEIITNNSPIFTNIFMQTQTLKQEVINLIRSARFITNQQDYIDTVISIPDTSIDLLEQFKKNIKQQIDKNNFDMIVENILNIAGGLLDTYCNGRYMINGRFTLPPLQGINEDLLDLYKTQYIKDKLLHSVSGNKLIKATTDPVVQCMIKMTLRVYNNYQVLNREKKYEEYVRQRQLQAKEHQGH